MEEFLIEKAAFIMVAVMVVSMLPTSPFQSYISMISTIPFLGYIGYFIPLAQMIAILEAWLVAISVYYGFMLVLRAINLIQ